MKRSEKQIENSIVKAMNETCETLKETSVGFAWLTHFVHYAQFPHSLKLVFVYDSNQHLQAANHTATFETIYKVTETHLKREGVHIKRIDKAIFFDTEENGADVNDAKWCRKYTH